MFAKRTELPIFHIFIFMAHLAFDVQYDIRANSSHRPHRRQHRKHPHRTAYRSNVLSGRSITIATEDLRNTIGTIDNYGCGTGEIKSWRQAAPAESAAIYVWRPCRYVFCNAFATGIIIMRIQSSVANGNTPFLAHTLYELQRTGMAATCVVQPIDLVKTRMQLSSTTSVTAGAVAGGAAQPGPVVKP